MVHRDVKPENLLVDIDANNGDHYTVKMIDFGISAVYDPDKKLTLSIGTVSFLIKSFIQPYYVAPEVI